MSERLDVSDVVDVGFEHADRVREPASWKHKPNYWGFYWATTCGSHVWHESLYERSALMRFDRNKNVTGIASQPMWIHWAEAPGHVPDFFVRFADRTCTLVDVKPAERTSLEDLETFERTRVLSEVLGWGYSVVADINELEQQNLRFLSGYRFDRWRFPAAIELVRGHAGTRAPLSSWTELLATACDEPLGAVYSSLWWQELAFDFNRKLSLDSVAVSVL